MQHEYYIKAILRYMQKNRTCKFMFDDDDRTDFIERYFRKKHYKVHKANSYTIIITKRWWQK